MSNGLKTSLGIWALGPMVTRFVPGGYKPEHAARSRPPRRSRRAVGGLGRADVDGYEFRYPGELDEDNLDEVAAHSTATTSLHGTGLHVDPRFGEAVLSQPRGARARRSTWPARPISPAKSTPADIWPGIEGYNYPFQSAVPGELELDLDGIGQAADRCADARNQPVPRAQELRAGNEDPHAQPRYDACTSSRSCARPGITNVKVNMDWQHLIMNGESLGEYAALLEARGAARPPARQLGLGDFDDDNMVGATAFMETLELALRAPARRLRGQRGRGSASTSIRTRRTRSPRCGGAFSSGASSTGDRRPNRRRRPPRGADGQGCRSRVRNRLRSHGRRGGVSDRRDRRKRPATSPLRGSQSM